VLVVASAKSNFSEQVVDVLAEWSAQGLIGTFLWCDAGMIDEAVRYRRIHEGSVVGDAPERLLANLTHSLEVVWVSFAGAEFEDAGDIGHHVANGVRTHLLRMAMDEALRADTRLIIPCAVGAFFDLVDDAFWSNVLYWAPEDRATPSALSTLLPELLSAYGANAISSVGDLFRRSPSSDRNEVLDLVFSRRQSHESAVVIGRSFTRVLEIPVITRELFSAITDADEVPFVDGDRIERRGDLPLNDLAHYFVQSQEALRPTVPELLSITDDQIEIGLREALKQFLGYLWNQIVSSQVDSFEKLVSSRYDKIAAFLEQGVAPGYRVKRWRELARAEVAPREERVRPRHHREVPEGPVAELWSGLWRSSFSLVDGTEFDWGVDGILNSGPVRSIALARSQVVSSPRDLLEAPSLQTELIALMEKDEKEASDTPSALVGASIQRTNYLRLVQVELMNLFKKLSDEHEKLVDIKEGITVDSQVEPDEEAKKKRWWQFWRRKKKKYDRKVIRARARRRIRRTLFGGGIFSLLVGGVTTFFFSPIVGIWSFCGLLLAAVARVIRVALKGRREEEEAIKAELEARIAEVNREERLATLAADIPRFQRRLREFADWQEIISLAIYSPWSTGAKKAKSTELEDWPRPFAVAKGVGALGPDDRFKLVNAFVRDTFRQGWLTDRFTMLRDELTDEIHELLNPSDDRLSYGPESDTLDDPAAPRKLFRERLGRRLQAEDVDPDLLERVERFLRARSLDEVVGSVSLQYPQLEGTMVESPELATVDISGEEFFAPLQTSGGTFLRTHWAPTIHVEPIQVDEQRSKLFGDSSGAGIQINVASNNAKAVPRVIVTRFEMTEQIPYESLLSSKVDIERPHSRSIPMAIHESFGEEVPTAPEAMAPLLEEEQDAVTDTSDVDSPVKSWSDLDSGEEYSLTVFSPESDVDVVPELEMPILIEEGMKFVIGYADGEPVTFWPANTELTQLNIGIAGDLGTGKTQLVRSLIVQLRSTSRAVQKRELPILIFDYKNDYQSKEFLDRVGGVRVSPSGIPLNVFLLPPNASQAQKVGRARAFLDVVTKLFSGVGPVQKSVLQNTIIDLYDMLGRSPTIEDVLREYLERQGKEDSISSVLGPFVQYGVFDSRPSNHMTFEDFLGERVVVIDLHGLGQDQEMKNFLVALFLNEYSGYMLTRPKWPYVGENPQLRVVNSYLVVDEASFIMRKHFEALESVLRQGREFGVGVILSSQFLDDFSERDIDYGEMLRTWFVHNVRSLVPRDLLPLGSPSVNTSIVAGIQEQGMLESFYSSLDFEGGVFIRDLPYFELGEEAKARSGDGA